MGVDERRSLDSSRARLRSQRLTDRREDSASRRRDEEPRTAVKDRGRRQSGGMISLSEVEKRKKECLMLKTKLEDESRHLTETRLSAQF